MQKYLLLIVFFLISGFSQSQNLIQNGSFDNPGCSVSIPLNWTNPTNGSPDFWSVCAGNAPSNWFGYQYPYSGDVFFGIVIKNSGGGTLEWREYVQNTFSSPMVVGQTYMLSMYVSLGEYSMYGSSSLGALFTTYPLVQATNLPISIPPQVSLDTANYITDTLNWQLVQMLFTADSAYTHVTLGNFLYDAQTTYILVDSINPYPRSYFLIDDAALTDVTGLEENNNAAVQIFPNPAADFVYIKNSTGRGILDFNIINQLGQIVLNSQIKGAGAKIDISTISNGIYFYQIGKKSGKLMVCRESN